MVKFNKVSVSFNQQVIFSKLNIHVKPGEFISIVGETGAGKTTILRLVYFDIFPDEGNITVGKYDSLTIKKHDIPKLRRTLGIVFQDYKLLEDRNVYENVRFTLEVTGIKQEDIDRRTLRVLADVGLSHKRNNRPEELSGGEQQRVVIARALVNHPILILADEPTGNLDRSTSMEILQLLKTINNQGTAIIMASHNYEVIRKSRSRIIQLKEGIASEIATI